MNTMSEVAKGPVFDHPGIQKPGNWRETTTTEFVVKPARPAQTGVSRHPWATTPDFVKLGEWFAATPAGREAWTAEAAFATKIVNQWHFEKTGFAASRYIYSLRDLSRLSLTRMFSGHELLGQFLQTHLTHIAALPPGFWLHAELRGKKAGLETAQTGLAFANALAASPDLFTPAQIADMDAALAAKALKPCLTWLRSARRNNWTAVIGTGTLVMSRYLGDAAAQQTAVKKLRWYVDSTVEADGSYGEGPGYFSYPMSTLFLASLAMTPAQSRVVFDGAPLAKSSRWMAYHYFHFRGKKGARLSPMRSHFHDNSHWGRFPSDVATLFAAVYGDGLARWLGTAFAASDDDPEAAQAEREGGRGEGESWQSRLFLQKSGAGSEAGSGSGSAVGAGSGSGLALKLPPAKTPAALGLPRVAAFDSGDNFIRSGWEDNGVVLALNNAGPTKTRYTHHHACRNSFVLAAHGEYLVVSPGSFSYRSPKHLTYDLSTRAQNTVEIDGKSQLLPGGGKARHAMNGQPVAKTTLAVEGRAVDVLASDATGAYGQPHKRIARVVIYARGGREGREGREAGYFVIFDRLEEPADGAAHSYAWRLHFNNRDGAALFSRANGGASAAAGATRGEGGEAWFLCRPKAGLEIVVGNENGNGTELDTSVGEAYMHGRGRDYAPGGANEGKPGSAIEFTVRNREKSAGMDFVAVLRPVAGTTADDTPVPLPVVLPVMLPVVLADGKVRVGDDVFTLRGNTLASTVGGVTEQFTVWPQRQP